ncbi:MAG: hypothetical protein EZS28_000155 [Streblomastix strix]|uniref:Uncharacterized protein n=1 Tax=Streblomastix strix TaxID=222440 RepID=A0A5J4XBW4_9EUKA|nr:MAG: hypothetical protein EZS28_000155 [Streblomastix strix]
MDGKPKFLRRSTSNLRVSFRDLQTAPDTTSVTSDDQRWNNIIRTLQTENQSLKQEKDDLEKQSMELTTSLETRLRDEKEQRVREQKQLHDAETELQEEQTKKTELENRS